MNFPITRIQNPLMMYVHNIADMILAYSQIRVDRALSGLGPWTEITAETAEQAEIPCRNPGPYTLHDQYLMLELADGTTLVHQFAGADPITAADAVAELNAASPFLDCYNNAGTLVLRTLDDGTNAVLRVAGGDACVNLGVSLNETAFGKAVDVPLVSGQPIYALVDECGHPDWAYRYRLVNLAPPREAPAVIIYPGQAVALDLDFLTVGYAHVVGVDGRAAYGKTAYISNKFVPLISGGRLVVNDQERDVDQNGDVWFFLIRGSTVEFRISGTPLHRYITVPDAPSFDLTDPSLVVDDPLGIVVPPYVSLPRTTP